VAMRVLFIYTDIGISVGYSCGIGALSAYLKRHGHETKLLHVSDELGYPLDPDRVVKDVLAYDPGLVCFSSVTNQWFYCKTLAKFIRRTSSVPICVGGHHANSASYEIIREKAVDFVCKGEGERPLLELVNRLERGESTLDVPNMLVKAEQSQIATGFAEESHFLRTGTDDFVPLPQQGTAQPSFYLDDGRGVCENKVGRWIDDLDSLDFEDREIFDFDRIVETRTGWAEVIASRGCPYACTYCFNVPFFNMYKTDLKDTNDHVKLKDFIRRRSVESTIAMLKQVRERYPAVKYFTFVDDVFAIYSRWLADLAPLYKQEIGLPFAATSQPLAFNEKIAALLKEMGCKVVKMGVEAGVPSIRNQVLNRNISDEVLIEGFTLARRYGLKPQAFNMIGLPTETIDDMVRTASLNAKLRAYIVWYSTFMPYPGTGLWDFCIKNELMDESKWDEVRSYRGGTVLKEKTFTRLDLEKMRVMFRWHLNQQLENECSDEYGRNIKELGGLSEDVWLCGEAETLWRQRENALDEKYRKLCVDHYVGKKYVNILWAKEYNYDLS
jgi:anaerobic magnesium-protoporphyrin IX monomethyl ester cyclase